MNSESKLKPPNESISEAAGGVHAPYPKLQPQDAVPVADTWSSAAPGSIGGGDPARSTPSQIPGYSSATTMPPESNPYVTAGPAPTSSMKYNMDKFKDAFDQWRKKASEATKKAEDLAENMWQHLKTAPSLTDAAVGKIAQGTKVLAEGGYEKVFQNTFDNAPDEKLIKSYGCYLSTSAGPVVGVLYVSTAKVAFCSDNPLSYKVSEEVKWSYYKVVISFNQLKSINPATSKTNPAEKFIQIISVDGHEFWFMGILNYDSAVKNLLGALQDHHG